MAATDALIRLLTGRTACWIAMGLLGLALLPDAESAVLPEDRIDLMYHGYDGGGLEVDGPAVLVRKNYRDKVSVWGHYYVDMVSSASIDVVTTASEYTEERKEYGVGVDYLRGKTLMSMAYINSEEPDYSANSVQFSISQDFFGDLTTLGISYGRAWDEVRRAGDAVFREDIDRQTYGVNLSQILTRNLIVNLTYQGSAGSGFFNNPYRQVRYLDSEAARGYSYQAEVYPGTRNTSATALRGLYYLPYRASLKGEYRYYSDSWGISAWNSEVQYVHPLPGGVTAELRYRFYTQTGADFYSDLFPRENAQNFMARNKELSDYSAHTFGIGASYGFQPAWLRGFKRGELNLFVDWIHFDYDDFRDLRVTDALPGEEPQYDFDALVLRAFVSFWL